MTDEEVLKVASSVGWNIEHKASCDYLVRFARALMHPLTDEQIDDLTRQQFGPLAASDMQRQFARLVEKAHGIT